MLLLSTIGEFASRWVYTSYATLDTFIFNHNMDN